MSRLSSSENRDVINFAEVCITWLDKDVFETCFPGFSGNSRCVYLLNFPVIESVQGLLLMAVV